MTKAHEASGSGAVTERLRRIIDRYELWKSADAEHYNVSADHLASELAVDALSATEQPSPAYVTDNFQQRVQPWLMACFGPAISGDRVERADRLLEEVFELLQSGGYDPARVLALRDYVWGRDKGEPSQEVGGVMVTLAAYCLIHNLNMHEAGEIELARIWTKVEKIRAKNAAKPTGSALPVTTPASAEAELRAEVERLRELVSRSEAERYKSCGELLARAEALKARLDTTLEPVAMQEAATTAILKLKDEGDIDVLPAVAIAQRVVKAIRRQINGTMEESN
jgi:hypothetical protein